jgi:hypothetical protein
MEGTKPDQINQSETELLEKQSQSFAQDIGRLFEIGFNTGFLSAIEKYPALYSHFGTLYADDLKHLQLSDLLLKMYHNTGIVTARDQEILQRWVLYILIKGLLSGHTLFEEYMQTVLATKRDLKRDILYLQCNFYGANSLDTYPKNEETAIQDVIKQLSAFGVEALTESEIAEHNQKGKFLKADTLMLLKSGRQWRVLCIDLSIFSIKHLSDLRDLSNVEEIRRLLGRELRYRRSKSVFSDLSIDTEIDNSAKHLLSSQLTNYFTAFKREDKETVKLIQAASYAYDFFKFLKKKKIIQEKDQVLFTIIGYTDRAINAMAVNQEQLSLLETCAHIYQQQNSKLEIDEAREHVFKSIQKTAQRCFQGGRKFIQALLHSVDDQDGIVWRSHTETVDTFTNTKNPLSEAQIPQNIRTLLKAEEYQGQHILDIHAAMVKRELASAHSFLFLTGCPGIGKTTAIVDFLKEAIEKGEGFLFVYVSPRKQVNLDIIEKFRENTKLPPCDKVLGLTANSTIIRNNQSRKTVHYYSQKRQDTFSEGGITFIHADSDEARFQRFRSRELEEIQEGFLIDKGERVSGVLHSLCCAVNAALEEPLSNAIVATVAIQSLKKLDASGKSTLRHLNILFKSVLNDRGIIPHKMEQFQRKIKHVFFMIDEVTGDESGVAFLQEVHTFLTDHDLLHVPGLNTKVIVADASLVDPKIIKRHLEETSYEPDKIYFRRETGEQTLPLSYDADLLFLREKAAVINANAYPASRLHMSYHIGVDCLQYVEETFVERSKKLDEQLQGHILGHILDLLKRDEVKQFIVYIQDKQRLARLIQAIRKARGTFEKCKDYLDIHANSSEKDKKHIQEYRKSARVIFMTASASRGLSFPEATHILIDIPHFEVEQNLMEILQVIYRGRGGGRDNEEKHLSFYLTDRVIYTNESDRLLSVRERMLHLLNVLLILKASIMTRLTGSLQTGIDQHFMMIPIGGRSTHMVGETFTSRISKLIREAKSHSHLHHDDKRLEHVSGSLKRLLEDVSIDLRPTGRETNAMRQQDFYLSLLPDFAYEFQRRARKGFHELLHFPNLEKAYIAGSLLLIPLGYMSMQEKYWLSFEQILKEYRSQGIDLLKEMSDLSRDPTYPGTFHHVLNDGLVLLQALQDMLENKIPRYEQESTHPDQHCAVPLPAFVTYESMKEFFHSRKELQGLSEEVTFRALLEVYTRSLYPSDSMLPIGNNYDDFPFLVFRSLNLGEARNKMFTGKYLFMSQEMNIINMLLSSEERDV